MKKNIKSLFVILAFSITLIGCSSDLPNMDDDQAAIIGEYAAGLLVRYDASNKSRLVDISLIQEEAIKEKEVGDKKEAEPKSPMAPVDDTPIVNEGKPNNEPDISLEDILQLPEGVTITFVEDTLMESYPEHNGDELVMGIDAVEGKKLLVLTFSITNQSQVDQLVDIFSISPDFNIKINNQITRSTLPTLLIDELPNFMEVIPAGTDKRLVLITELNENISNNISSLSLNVKCNNQSTTVFLR